MPPPAGTVAISSLRGVITLGYVQRVYLKLPSIRRSSYGGNIKNDVDRVIWSAFVGTHSLQFWNAQQSAVRVLDSCFAPIEDCDSEVQVAGNNNWPTLSCGVLVSSIGWLKAGTITTLQTPHCAF